MKKQDAIMHANSPQCVVYQYAMKNKEMNIALAEVTGRYPAKGFVINRKCNEMGYIVEGSGKLVTESQEVALSQGDVIYIPPDEKFYWEGTITILIPAAPAWYPEQHEQDLPLCETADSH